MQSDSSTGRSPAPPRHQKFVEEPHQLIVNHLPVQCLEPEFKAIFEQIGPVRDIKLVRDKGKETHRGFGFVSFVDPSHAAVAIDRLDAFEMYDGVIKVAFSTRRTGESSSSSSS